MKLIKYFLQKRSVTLLLLLLIFFGGLFAYAKMGKLEDAPFTIKQALVLTPYSGASPSEVQSQVTDVLEEAIQSLGELYYLKTENRAGLSKITVYVKKEIRADEMQQLWDKLRRKVGDVQSKLPAGAGPSVVNDDFGDVLGVFYGLTGEGHTYRELEEQAKQIKNELLNAIVVSDSALVNMQRGMRKRVAILRACSSTALPLLAATVIAILTFMPIYYSPHITGELLSSLVIVIGVSLMFSWVFALTQTPFFIQEFVRRPRPEELKAELFGGKLYECFRSTLRFVIRHKFVTICMLVLLLILSAWSFKFIPKVFVPLLDKQYFTIDMWLPEGTRIEETDKLAVHMADYIRQYPQTEVVSAYIGRTPPRYYLSNVAFGPQANYAQLLVKCKTSRQSRELHRILQDSIPEKYPEPFIKVNKFELSPLTEAVIEARFLGPDAAVLDSLTNVAIEIMRKNPKVAHARNEWGNMSMLIRPVYDPVKAGVLGITKTDMMKSVKSINDGLPVGIYRDNEKKVPVLLKSEATQITTAEALGDFAIWNGTQSAPLSQVTKKIETDWEFPVIKTYNRQLSMAAMCGVKPGTTMAEVHGEIRQEIENIQLPAGYSFFWDSQFKDQGEAIQAIVKFFPLAFLLLIVILVALFGNFREPVIILCILPLSLIGVAIGMLLTGFEFGFFPIAGWLGLLGMIIKNVIVLIDEINVQHRQGIDLYTSIIEATVSRTRPVLMAATTTIFGMVPLLFDIAFRGMAATIIFGLTFATLLTLFVTPVLYVLFYKVKEKRV